MVIEAARDIKAGLDFESILEGLKALQDKVQLYYILETLEYLRRVVASAKSPA